MKILKVDRTASGGIASGRAFVLEEQDLSPDLFAIAPEQAETEVQRYTAAVDAVSADLAPLAEKEEIFAAHLELVQDEALRMGVCEKIETGNVNAEKALHDTAEEYAAVFEMMEDEYMRERAADLKDIRNRLMRKLKNLPETDLSGIREKVILVAKDLAPSDTAKLDLNFVQGFITEGGGVTSHVAIMAKNLGLPALVGVKGVLEAADSGDFIILDADEKTVYVNPESEIAEEYVKKQEEQAKRKEELLKLRDLKAVTTDGHEVEICANVGNLDDIRNALKFSIDGVGLFRSEFLYMENDHFPTEEEQFEVYKAAAELLGGRELTIRTLDIGGDKGLSYFEFPKEENPFLGYRAIRIGLDRTEILKTQLKALLRAGCYGRIRIMYPMIISVEELRSANSLLEECKNELRTEGKAFAEKPEVGIMIETPAAVMMAEELGAEADFFSIGTNDLTQYFLAVDRGNEKISAMYNPFHPGVLRAIARTIEAGHAAGIKVGMCGEFAGNPDAVPILLGLGLDEFSMSAGSTLEVKQKIRQAEYQKSLALAERILKTKTVPEVEQRIQEWHQDNQTL